MAKQPRYATRLQDLIKQGAQKIVIDLRDTAGGSINEAVAVANLFIKDGVLAQTIGREGKALKTFSADPKATLFSRTGCGDDRHRHGRSG